MDMDFLQGGAVEIARTLLGYRLYAREGDGSLTGGIITETEAYTANDAASHSYRGQTKRNEVMFGASGKLYVYFTYGMHWCLNIVTGPVGVGEAVLIRSLAIDQGLPRARTRRGNRPDSQLANGPAKICQALGVTGSDNGADLQGPRILLQPPDSLVTPRIIATPRIGIRSNTDQPWRFLTEDFA